MKRCPAGRKPCARLMASRSRRISSLRNSTIRLHDVQCKMVVSGIAVIVLERAAVGQPQLAKQPGLDQQPERPVHRRPADALAGIVQVADQLVGIEVLVRIEDVLDQHPPALGQLLAPDLQELAELLDRGVGDDQGSEVIALGFHDVAILGRIPVPLPRHGAGWRIDNDSPF